MTIKVEQSQADDGSYQATITLPGPHTITVSVYPDNMLTNGLPQIVGYVYPPSEHLPDGSLRDESEPAEALDSDIV